MEKSKENTKYQISIAPEALDDLGKLDFPVRKRITEKIDWLGENTDVLYHHQLSSLPDELKGLCRIHVGDWVVLYWIYRRARQIKIYGVEHRSKVYRKIR